MESRPQNPEFRNNPENFRPCALSNAGPHFEFKSFYFESTFCNQIVF